ncbi:MAG: hypothetical protein ACFFHD_15915, partial [Promethearchaeota archaeon]
IEATQKIVEAIKINFGFIHAEYIIDNNLNKPFLIEIANRGGGVHISNKILPKITGIDLQKKYIELAMGNSVKIVWDGKYVSKALMYFINPGGNKDPKELTKKYPSNILAFWMKDKKFLKDIKSLGALGRAGMVILSGDEFEVLENIGKEIEKKIGFINYEYYWGGDNK